VKTVSRISVAPVKGFRLLHPDEVDVTPAGVVENRRFFLTDGQGKRLRSSLTPWPVRIEGRYDAASERLWMRFPDGTEVEGGTLDLGQTVRTNVSLVGDMEARVVHGPWTKPLSALAGHPVRLVRPEKPGDVYAYPVTFLSEASVARLGEEAGTDVDGRRFRLLFTLAGCEPHEEDGWAGRSVAVGEAVVRVAEPVDRCAVTTRNPDTGKRDLDTLALIKGYRGMPRGTIDFGMLAAVERPGRVRVGDAVELIA
jgi:uncharacterized protein YcbX